MKNLIEENPSVSPSLPSPDLFNYVTGEYDPAPQEITAEVLRLYIPQKEIVQALFDAYLFVGLHPLKAMSLTLSACLGREELGRNDC